MSNPTVEIKGATGTVFLTGRFTFDVQKAFKEAVNPLLDNPAIRTIAIDLSAASYMDSAAAGDLLLVREKATTTAADGAAEPKPHVLPIPQAGEVRQAFRDQ